MNLTGQFLIAMPGMTDPNFAKSITYLWEHSEEGAVGLVINRPFEMDLQALFKQLNMPTATSLADHPIYFGGPMQQDRGFVLHQPLQKWDSTMDLGNDTGLTTSRDILQAIADGNAPSNFLISLGYAGWSPGQLEEEIAQNAWLTIEATAEQRDHLLFNLAPQEKVGAAMALLGLDFSRLTEVAGHA